jgi:hypothetical protein
MNPYKRFPEYEYFDILHAWWEAERILFIEKSRTMMASWWAAAETLHYVMTHQPSKGIFWAQDEDRSLALLDYAWTLYEKQDAFIKKIFPLDRPKDRQSYKRGQVAYEPTRERPRQDPFRASLDRGYGRSLLHRKRR